MLLVVLCFLMEGVKAQSTSGEEETRNLTYYQQVKRQANPSITIELNNVLLSEALKKIAEKAGAGIYYNADMLPDKKISIRLEDTSLGEVLRIVLAGTDLEAITSGRNIALRKKEIILKELVPVILQQTITGRVTDANTGESLPGVNIAVKGTTTGTSTGSDGRYELNVPSLSDTLVFSFIGFQTREVPINGRTEINVQLSPQAVMGEEMVVTGYATEINRREVTGAVSTVNMSDFNKRKVSEVSEALQGQVAGVQVTQSTGAPGDDVQIRIRGEGTIGNNSPLFIIDGVPSRDISFLNPSDIKSMNVLKDASAAAIYGSRASAGVIIVETKEGTREAPSFNLDYFGGIGQVVNLPQMLDARQYMNTVEKAWDNAGYSGTNPYTADKERSDFTNTDWLNELFEPGYTHNISMSASGGNDNTRYYISSRYYTEDGVVIYGNDKLEVLNVRANINSDLTDRFQIGTNLQLSHSKEDNLNSQGDAPGIIRHGMLRPPILSVRKDKDDPYYTKEDPFTDLPFYKGPDNYESNKYEFTQNPIALANFTDDEISEYRTFGNMYGEYSFLKNKNLKFRTNVGIDLQFYHRKDFKKNFGDDDGGGLPIDSGLGRINRPNQLSENREEILTVTWNNTLNYRKKIGLHSLKTLAGSEFITNSVSNLGASRQRFDFDSPNFRYIDFGGTDLGLSNGGSGSEWSLFSYFGSVTYDYDKRYLFTANFRADASSRFADNHQWGYFPSLSAGWMISEEKFIDDMDWISQLKLRASWGQLGNQEIPNYAFLTLLRRNSAGQYEVSRYGNPNLKWETTTQKNLGVDFLFKDRLNLSVEYFDMLTSDILLPITLPEVVGEVSPTFVNSGEVRNKGLEFSINYENNKNEFRYNINANLATLRNKVEKLHPNLPNIVGEVTRTQPGHPLNAYFGYVMEGIYQNDEEINSHLYGMSNPSVRPGDIRFKDLDGNGIINSEDRKFIGSPHPDLTFGINFTGEYKGFDVSVFFQGIQGIDKYNDAKKIVDYDTRPFNYTTRVLNSWDGEGSSNTIPRVSFTDNGGSKISSVYVEDGSYLRLKNLEIGYSLDSALENLLSTARNFRVYVSAQNVFTLTDYTALDPESTGLVDFGTYPQSRTFMFGISTSF